MARPKSALIESEAPVMRITRIRLVAAAPIGKGSIMEHSIGVDQMTWGSGVKPTLTFATVEGYPCIHVVVDGWTGLIPMSNVAAIEVTQ